MGADPQNKKLQRNAHPSEDEWPRTDKTGRPVRFNLDCFFAAP